MCGIRTHDLTRNVLKSYPLHHMKLFYECMRYVLIYHKNKNFLHKGEENFVILKKNLVSGVWQKIALKPMLLGFSVPRPYRCEIIFLELF